jgi:hypothetical protein
VVCSSHTLDAYAQEKKKTLSSDDMYNMKTHHSLKPSKKAGMGTVVRLEREKRNTPITSHPPHLRCLERERIGARRRKNAGFQGITTSDSRFEAPICT